MIEAAQLVVGTVTSESSATVSAGTVIRQSPSAGTVMVKGATVNLVVSSGLAQALVPDVVGRTQADATTALTSAGLTVGSVTQAHSGTIPVGSVVSQSVPAGISVYGGTAVDLVVSLGLAQATVPNVVGSTQADATTALTAAGLTVGTVTQTSSETIPVGSVVSQSVPAGSSVSLGTAVNLVISTGSTQTTVPNVVGQPQAAAQTALEAAGLSVGTVAQTTVAQFRQAV